MKDLTTPPAQARPAWASPTTWRLPSLSLVVMGALFAVAPAYAGSSDMPWEGPLQKILTSITGPVAKVIGVCLIVGFGLGFAASEAGGAIRKAMGLVFGISIAFAAAQWGLTFFGYSGGAAL